MPTRREQLQGESLEQLADRMQDGPGGSSQYHPAAAELERRKAVWQRDAAIAAQEAASAEKSTAEYTQRTAHYMLWSVWAIFATSGASALFSILAWAYPRH
jgi:hypothetical protein